MKFKRLIFVILAVALCVAVLPACNKDDSQGVAKLEDFDLPSDIAEDALAIEWQDKDGKPTAYDKNKSTVILFEGEVTSGYKSKFGLDTSIYSYNDGNGNVAESSKNIDYNLASYWINNNYNVGVFRYECFGADTAENLVSKLYNDDNMTYVNNEGETRVSNGGFSLTELFSALWLNLQENEVFDPKTQLNYVREVRFVGNSVGANLAVAAADYLWSAYGSGAVDGYCLPNRVALTNPYFSNKSIDLQMDFGNKTYSSALAYNSEAIAELAAKGVVFELYESDFDFYNSYETPYSGLITANGGTTLGDEGDCALYNTILDNSVSLMFSESYSAGFSNEYAALNRVSLDWYLYSMYGSDSAVVATTNGGGANSARPMTDDIAVYTAGRMYAASAWTPTAYERALRGTRYLMQTKTYSASAGDYGEGEQYTLAKLAAETKQVSQNFDKIIICGYFYVSQSGSKYLDLAPQNAVSGIKLLLKLDIDGNGKQVVEYKATTGSDGFYCLTIDPKYLDYEMELSFGGASGAALIASANASGYNRYLTSDLDAYSEKVSEIHLERNSTLSYVVCKNCGMVRK